jgi:hypothetical protein
VKSSHRATTALRSSISRAAALGKWFLYLGALFVDILHGLIERGTLHMTTDQLIGNGLRWGQRISVDIPVQVAAEDSPAIRGHLKSISLSGALMEADHELRLHAYIEVRIKLPETGRSAMRIMARVARKSKDAVGVEWCEFAPSTIKGLLRSPSIRLPL